MTGWDELVAAATVGTGTRALVLDEHLDVGSADEPASALLDAAALLLARRRAGSVPDRDDRSTSRAPAAPDAGPELTATGCRILDLQLGRRDELLLPALLDATAAAGRRVPPPLLPALLDAATRMAALRPVAARIGGRRARWLAGHRPEWSWLDTPPDPADPDVWATGGRAARPAHLAALRATDPAAARELLVTTWTRETGDDRAAFVAVLREGLDIADEPFLEAALDDRAAGVRAAAADLLALLPGSGHAARCAARVREVRHTRAIAEWTPAMGRDGIPHDPPPGSVVPHGTWWLSQAIARAPLSAWDGDPAALVRATVAERAAPEIHAGWRVAARREGHRQWIAALLATPPRLDDRTAAFRRTVWVADAELAAALPPRDRATRIAHLLRSDPATLRLAELGACPRPWPPVLADAVLARLAAAAAGEPLTPGARELARHAGAGLPVAYLDAVEGLAGRAPEFTAWPGVLRATVAVLGVRRTFQNDLTEQP